MKPKTKHIKLVLRTWKRTQTWALTFDLWSFTTSQYFKNLGEESESDMLMQRPLKKQHKSNVYFYTQLLCRIHFLSTVKIGNIYDACQNKQTEKKKGAVQRKKEMERSSTEQCAMCSVISDATCVLSMSPRWGKQVLREMMPFSLGGSAGSGNTKNKK